MKIEIDKKKKFHGEKNKKYFVESLQKNIINMNNVYSMIIKKSAK